MLCVENLLSWVHVCLNTLWTMSWAKARSLKYWVLKPRCKKALTPTFNAKHRGNPIDYLAGVLRAGRQVSLSHCRRRPSSCPTTDRADFHERNERRQQADKSRMLSWQMWPCLLELCVTAFLPTIWEYRKMTRFVKLPGWHLPCSTQSSDLWAISSAWSWCHR